MTTTLDPVSNLPFDRAPLWGQLTILHIPAPAHWGSDSESYIGPVTMLLGAIPQASVRDEAINPDSSLSPKGVEAMGGVRPDADSGSVLTLRDLAISRPGLVDSVLSAEFDAIEDKTFRRIRDEIAAMDRLAGEGLEHFD